VSMLLEDGEPQLESEFVGVQTIKVACGQTYAQAQRSSLPPGFRGSAEGFPQAVPPRRRSWDYCSFSLGPRHLSHAAAQDCEGHWANG
jgi:hypothetical protein